MLVKRNGIRSWEHFIESVETIALIVLVHLKGVLKWREITTTNHCSSSSRLSFANKSLQFEFSSFPYVSSSYGCLLFTTSMFFSLFRCFLAGCYLLKLVFPFRKRGSWLFYCLERSLEECVYLSIAPIRRVAWLLFFTERSVQTCREEVEEKERDLVRLKAVFLIKCQICVE